MGDADTGYVVCRTVLDEVRDALDAVGRPVVRSHVAVGVVPWDDCCGMLVVAPERVYRSEDFPTEYLGAEFCWGGSIVVDLVVLLVRCVPTLNEQGEAPPADDLDDAYRSFLEDAATVWNTLAGPLGDDWERAGLAQLFSGEQGGCIAVESRLTVGVDAVDFPG